MFSSITRLFYQMMMVKLLFKDVPWGDLDLPFRDSAGLAFECNVPSKFILAKSKGCTGQCKESEDKLQTQCGGKKLLFPSATVPPCGISARVYKYFARLHFKSVTKKQFYTYV